ncbi:MAG: DnaD domain protein [Chloroflexota bacterium]|nr:DnaD domain protein [Chloroflexota bacterium]
MSNSYAGFMIRDEVVALPAELFESLLLEIDDLSELKLTLFTLSAIQQKEGGYRYLRYDELRANKRLMASLQTADDARRASDTLDGALERAVRRGTLLEALVDRHGRQRRIFTLNDRDGQKIHRQLAAGEWMPSGDDEIEILPPRPTLYGLYEENIGLLTPMIVEAIREAEAEFPKDWIEDAMRTAAERNARNWRYIRKVLDNWRHEGRRSEKAGQDLERHKQYTAGEWKDFIES